jgi:hypothetical protein
LIDRESCLYFKLKTDYDEVCTMRFHLCKNRSVYIYMLIVVHVWMVEMWVISFLSVYWTFLFVKMTVEEKNATLENPTL